MLQGLDYAWGRPSITSITSGGFHFACRYLSHDTSGKNLSLAEATKLSAAGIWLVVVYESTADRMLAGFSAGAADAVFADAQAKSYGMPDGRPIYFACDFDATSGQQAAINAYLDGAASKIGKDRVGIYGGLGPVSRALDGDHCHWAWQTYAWSGGKWDARAQIQQYENGITVGGVDCDRDRAMTDTHPDYGQWKIGAVPDVALTSADLDAIRKIVWEKDLCPAPAGSDPNNPTWQYQNVMREAESNARDASHNAASATDAANAAKVAADGATTEIHTAKNEILAVLAAQPTPQDDTDAIIAGVLAGLNPDALADRIATDLGPGVAGQVLDALRARLEA